MHRAYSLLHIKSVDDEQRIISGIASTPATDRRGDIVEPKGIQFTLPIPLLLFHNAQSPIGEVFEATVTAEGIAIQARIFKAEWPESLKASLDHAWGLVRIGLVRGLSIGFKPLEGVDIKGTQGTRFLKWLWLELSAVTIPANQDASILAVKSVSDTELAALGTQPEIAPQPAGVSASSRVVKLIPRKEQTMPKPIAEQIKAFEATRQAKAAERDAIMEASAEAGQTLDAAQTEQYDTLDVDIKALDEHLRRLRALEESNKQTLKAVVATTTQEASISRDTSTSPVISVKDTTPPDVDFARMVLCKAASFIECAKGNFVSPLQIAKARYPSSDKIQQYLIAKTNVAAGTTTDANHHAALLATATTLESAFLEYLRPMTIVGRFGLNGIPALRRVPFNVKIQSQTSGASASWVGEGKAKPVTSFNTTSTTLLFTKIACISVITEELARFSMPGAEGVVRDELTRAVVERMDTDFIDPAKAVSSGVNPASITNGLVALTSVGTSAANVLTDLQNLIAPFLVANYNVSDLVLIMPNTLALVLSLMENSLGQPAFAGISVTGGTLRGIPVITSQYAASGASYGNMVIAVSASNIALADDGRVTVDASREASIEMSDAPANEVVTPTASSYTVSMFQTNSIALRAEREINWKKLRTNAVTFMDDVNWGSIGSPV